MSKILIYRYLLFFVYLLLWSCQEEKTKLPKQKSIKIDSKQAERLANLPLNCLQREYPNSTNQVLHEASDLGTPKQLHPAFYGCYDWHSSVHGYWTLAVLLRAYPQIAQKKWIVKVFIQNLSAENIKQEIAYLKKSHEYSFERPYGWVWLFQLQQELDTHPEPEINNLAKNLQPLTNLLIGRFFQYLPQLQYPIRVGAHNNTAFGMNLAWDYVVSIQDKSYQQQLKKEAKRLFFNDKNCPFKWETSGTDFLSPCLEEMTLMNKILNKKMFLEWAKQFAPELFKKDFSWEMAYHVSEQTDTFLVHLDGLNFSRAWNLYDLSSQHTELAHLKPIAEKHLLQSLPYIINNHYEGEHWLATFALKALMSK
ncbi:hypothetical protein AD998_15095 [bacterium 336/3]|nr:hypothetical protein AD998_15095 [bacterium 336/3]